MASLEGMHLELQGVVFVGWDTDMKLGDVSDDVKYLQIAYMILGYAPVARRLSCDSV